MQTSPAPPPTAALPQNEDACPGNTPVAETAATAIAAIATKSKNDGDVSIMVSNLSVSPSLSPRDSIPTPSATGQLGSPIPSPQSVQSCSSPGMNSSESKGVIPPQLPPTMPTAPSDSEGSSTPSGEDATSTSVPASSTSTSTTTNSASGGDTMRKIFVGGLSYATTNAGLHTFFAPFGGILEAVVICERATGRSRGYGFVVFADEAGAQAALADPSPCIEGRRCNVNMAYLGAKRHNNKRRNGGGVGLRKGNFFRGRAINIVNGGRSGGVDGSTANGIPSDNTTGNRVGSVGSGGGGVNGSHWQSQWTLAPSLPYVANDSFRYSPATSTSGYQQVPSFYDAGGEQMPCMPMYAMPACPLPQMPIYWPMTATQSPGFATLSSGEGTDAAISRAEMGPTFLYSGVNWHNNGHLGAHAASSRIPAYATALDQHLLAAPMLVPEQ